VAPEDRSRHPPASRAARQSIRTVDLTIKADPQTGFRCAGRHTRAYNKKIWSHKDENGYTHTQLDTLVDITAEHGTAPVPEISPTRSAIDRKTPELQHVSQQICSGPACARAS
jgi:hypothetical protein